MGKKEAGDKKKEKDDKKKKEKEAKKKKEKPKEPKIIQIKEPLQFESKIVDSIGFSKIFNSSKEKLHKLDEIDRIKQERETSLNDLESFILNIREKMYEDLYEKSSTEEEREKITEKCTELS